MSSKAAKRKKAFEGRERKRRMERERITAIRNAEGIEELAVAMGVKLR